MLSMGLVLKYTGWYTSTEILYIAGDNGQHGTELGVPFGTKFQPATLVRTCRLCFVQ